MKIPQDIDLPVDIEAFCREAIKSNPMASQAELLSKIAKLSRGKVNPKTAKAYLAQAIRSGE